MASENKKRKAKNSYLLGGCEKQHIYKMKRIAYYTKADRTKAKKAVEKDIEKDIEVDL